MPLFHDFPYIHAGSFKNLGILWGNVRNRGRRSGSKGFLICNEGIANRERLGKEKIYVRTLEAEKQSPPVHTRMPGVGGRGLLFL